MKNRSLLVVCIFLLNGLGCSLAPNNFGTDGGSARFSRRSRGPDFVTLAKQLQPAVVNVSVTTLPVPSSTPGVQPQGSFSDGTFGEFFGVPPTLARRVQLDPRSTRVQR